MIIVFLVFVVTLCAIFESIAAILTHSAGFFLLAVLCAGCNAVLMAAYKR